ncbi:MAG: TrkA-N domain protein [Gallionellaceae bacterium]|nr:MAG: TrkA-N domain protein [Gallionellaceae bacterium]
MKAQLSTTTRNLLWSLLAALMVMLIGTLGYRWLGGDQYSWLDCFYMTFITVATIGYGEIVDVTDYEYGRLFTVFIALSGIGILGYALSAVTAFMLEGEFNEVRRRNRMEKKIGQLKGHYIVCGMGQIGSNVAHELAITGRHFVMVDRDKANLEHYVEQHPAQLYVMGDATDNEVLLAAGIKHAIGIFAVAHEDNQNLVISLSAKQLNPEVRVIARCHDVKNVVKIKSAGADEIVSPDFTGGVRMVSAMVRPNVAGFLDEITKAEGDLRMEELVIPGRLHGKTLDMFYQDNQECLVMAVNTQGKWYFKPSADYLLHGGDVLMVMASVAARARMEAIAQG